MSFRNYCKERVSPLITLNDVAKAAKVSPATVSLALNGNPCVKAQTRERIIRLAREMGYAPNRMAQGLARRRSGLLGLVVPDIESIYYGKVVHSIDEAVSQNGYQLTLAISSDNQDSERKIIGKFIEQQVEGVLVAPINRPVQAADYYHELARNRIPFLFATSYYPTVPAPWVMADLASATRELTGHLIAKGCRRFCFLAGFAEAVTTECRVAGFFAAIRQAAAQDVRQQIRHCPRVDYAAGFAQTLALLRESQASGTTVDAIIAINDEMALGALNAAASLGIRVPEQLAIAGFDNVIFSSAANIPITTIEQNIGLICRTAVERLCAMIQSGKDRAVRPEGHLIPTQLIIRHSTDFGAVSPSAPPAISGIGPA